MCEHRHNSKSCGPEAKTSQEKVKESLHSCPNKCYIQDMMMTINVFIITKEGYNAGSMEPYASCDGSTEGCQSSECRQHPVPGEGSK